MDSNKHNIAIKIIDRNGVSHKVECPTDMDLNLMEVCKASDLQVEGTCGGIALCSTCHVYVTSEHEIFERSEAEEDMLDQAFFVTEKSRLGCQMKIDETLNNLEVQLAPQAE